MGARWKRKALIEQRHADMAASQAQGRSVRVCAGIEKGERDPRSQRPNPVGNPNSIRSPRLFFPTRFSKNDHDSHLLDCADTLIKARACLSRKQSESPIAPAHSTPPLHFASDSRVPQAALVL